MLGVRLGIKESIASEAEPEDIVPGTSVRGCEYFSEMELPRPSSWDMFPPKHLATPEKTEFWKMFRRSIAQVPTNEHLMLTMDANASTGKREGGEGLDDVQM